ncbi:MAG: class I SAM-dependent methyltransferase [Alphaproteobacteria bacterium]|nr:class I SAM-dependent methyltransferase [Alphaproteobacteria bacterium]
MSDTDLKEDQPKSLISEDYRKLQSELHADRADYGVASQHWAGRVAAFAKLAGVNALLDYGAGKQRLGKALDDAKAGLTYKPFDPAIEEISTAPEPEDLVVCLDVLEHIEPDLIENVLDDLHRVTKRFGFFTIATGPARKVLSDGRNAHLIQERADWWLPKILERFQLLHFNDQGHALLVIVAHKDEASATAVSSKIGSIETEKKDPIKSMALKDYEKLIPSMSVAVGHEKIQYYTPNSMCAWRVKTLSTKEPVTIDWLAAMEPGTVLVDIGANVGMYTMFAAVVRKMFVYAFEPESQNYAILNRNIHMNNVNEQVTAYPFALSDESKVSNLFLSNFSQGSSVHTFGQNTDHNLQQRSGKQRFVQGSVSVTLDELVADKTIPAPHYLKIDVDGLEHKVIKGCEKTLRDQTLREVLIELNPKLEEHQWVIKELQAAGFDFDKDQVAASARKEGSFEGVGEYVFRRR